MGRLCGFKWPESDDYKHFTGVVRYDNEEEYRAAFERLNGPVAAEIAFGDEEAREALASIPTTVREVEVSERMISEEGDPCPSCGEPKGDGRCLACGFS